MFFDDSFGVYIDSETVLFHFDQFKKKRFRLYETDIERFISTQYQFCVAGFHVDFPANDHWLNRVEQVYDHCDHVFIFCSELHKTTVQQLVALDRERVTFYICGQINFTFANAQVKYWMDWFHTSSEFYARYKPDFLADQLDPYSTKPRCFDVLLGNQRTHRDFVHNYIQEKNLESDNLMTYVRFAHLPLNNNEQFILEDEGVEYYADNKYTHSVHKVQYYGTDITISQIVPIKIYRQTAYSLVAETNAANEFNFYTEKIVKPMLARRLFIVIAGQNYLKNLRKFGFRTFSSVLDESYDSIEDDQTRWIRALREVHRLCREPQQVVLEKIKPIVEHNYRLITEKNWYLEFNSELEFEVNSLINNSKVSPISVT